MEKKTKARSVTQSTNISKSKSSTTESSSNTFSISTSQYRKDTSSATATTNSESRPKCSRKLNFSKTVGTQPETKDDGSLAPTNYNSSNSILEATVSEDKHPGTFAPIFCTDSETSGNSEVNFDCSRNTLTECESQKSADHLIRNEHDKQGELNGQNQLIENKYASSSQNDQPLVTTGNTKDGNRIDGTHAKIEIDAHHLRTLNSVLPYGSTKGEDHQNVKIPEEFKDNRRKLKRQGEVGSKPLNLKKSNTNSPSNNFAQKNNNKPGPSRATTETDIQTSPPDQVVLKNKQSIRSKVDKPTMEENYYDNKNMISKSKIQSYLSCIGKELSAQKLAQVTSSANNFIDEFLTRLSRTTTKPNGMFSYTELESALQIQGLISKRANSLALEFTSAFTLAQLKRMEGILTPVAGENDTHNDIE